MRVAVVGPISPPAGGMAAQTQQLVALLSSEVAKVHLIPVNAPYWPAWIGRVRGLRAVFRLIPFVHRLFRVCGEVDVLHVMGSSGWAWHLFATPAIWLAHLRGVPVIVNYRGGEAAGFLERSSRLVTLSAARAAAVVVPSEFLRNIFQQYDIRVRVIPNIVDLSLFQPNLQQRNYEDGPHLVVARNLEPIYDVATAIHAFAVIRQEFPNARLSVAGTGPDRQRLEQLVRDLQVRSAVSFTGMLDRIQMRTLLSSADALLNPSTADNMPNSILEALASRVVVISTNVGGVPFMVENGKTALLVPPRDPAAMAMAGLRVLRDPALAERLRSAGLAEVRQYAWDQIRDLWLQLYVDCIAGRVNSVN